jgi:signal transduction histidine kinase
VIFTRADRSDVQTLNDLRGKTFAAVHANAFGGWWMAWRELKAHGLDPESDFARLDFTGFPQDKIVFAVKNGDVAAGTVRTDVLERMAEQGQIDLKEFRILNPQINAGFPFLLSTQLYPEWPLALVNHRMTRLAQEVSVALLSMPEDGPEAAAARIAGWTVPLDYHTVHDLMRELRVGPYRTYGMKNLREIFSLYWRWVVFGFLLLIMSASVVVYVLRLNRQLQRSASTLESEIEQRTEAQRLSKAQAKRVRALYTVASQSGMTYDEEIVEILRTGCVLLGLEMGKVVRIDLPQNKSVVVAVHAPEGFALKPGDVLPLDKTYCIIPSLSKRPFAVDHAAESKWRNLPCYTFSGMESYIAAPIWVNQEFFGTVSYASRTPRGTLFVETDMDLVQLMGRWIGVTLERRAQQHEVTNARADAVSASRTKSEFLARMSHELRTPLNAIIGYSEMMIDDDGSQTVEQRRADLERVRSSGKQLLALINDILDLSKIEAGKMVLVNETFKIAGLLDDVIATIQPTVVKNKNVVELVCEGDLGTITADMTKLRQIVLNVLSNASKFTANGRITINVDRRVENAQEWLVFAVADTGIGMSATQMEHLFEDFSPANMHTVHKYGGTGLGMAISKKFCTMMGGDMEAMSAPKKGATFVIRIPARPNKVEEAVESLSNSAA